MHELHVHHHFHREGQPPPSFDVDILAAIKGLREQMSKLQDALAANGQAEGQLADAVNTLITNFLAELAAEPQKIADAVAKALADAGVSDEQAAAAVDAATAQTQALLAKVQAALDPSHNVGVGTDTTTATVAETTQDAGAAEASTVSGGAGDDSIEAGAGEPAAPATTAEDGSQTQVS
jgi:hypothetical protein